MILRAVAENAPFTQSFFSEANEPILEYSVYDLGNNLLGLESFPIAYQFWFIRDLIVIIVLCPLIHLILRTVPRIALGVIFALWYFNLWSWYIPSVAALAFFYAGAYFATRRIHPFSLDRYGPAILVV
ncbi:MAG: hypothetical protein J6386_11520 [Candidatus Synoicihabitans palmerolidicus]|nr:hypothetical protein [Candidatus Synoicihabitans palmerolidicus]